MERILLFIALMIPVLCEAQENNPLPPGPSTISGKVVDANGEPVPKAKVTVLYPDSIQRAVDTFTANAYGYFTAYVYRYNEKYINLQIKVNGKVCRNIRYDDPGRGVNLSMGKREFVCEIER